MLITNLDSLESEVLSLLERLDFEGALSSIVNFVREIVYDPQAMAEVFGSGLLDRLCLKIGNAFEASIQDNWRSNKQGRQKKMSVIVASHIDRYGGHTLVIEDFARNQPDVDHILLVTNLYNKVDLTSIADRLSFLNRVDVTSVVSYSEKLLWLIRELKAIDPDQIVIFNHHEDAICISAMEIFSSSAKIVFYHHADHNVCLGVHLPGATHLDPHNIGFHNCRSRELIDNFYVPLTVEDRVKRLDLSSLEIENELNTGSSGSFLKFSSNYLYPYRDLIVKRLKLRDGIHVHIGNIPEEELENILEGLKREGCDPKRFIHVPWVKSLWDTLVKHRVNLYISSFPLGGGRATIEAMGAGIPILVHQNNMSRFHAGADLVYPEALVWSKAQEFYSFLAVVDKKLIKEHSILARKYFEKYHHPSLLNEALKNALESRHSSQPPPMKKYEPDFLQRYLQSISEGPRGDAERMRNKIDDLNLQIIEKDKVILSITSGKSWKFIQAVRRVRSIFSRFRVN